MPRGLPVESVRTCSSSLRVKSEHRVPWEEPVGIVLSLFIILGRNRRALSGKAES